MSILKLHVQIKATFRAEISLCFHVHFEWADSMAIRALEPLEHSVTRAESCCGYSYSFFRFQSRLRQHKLQPNEAGFNLPEF